VAVIASFLISASLSGPKTAAFLMGFSLIEAGWTFLVIVYLAKAGSTFLVIVS
jgi:hypothetical protein